MISKYELLQPFANAAREYDERVWPESPDSQGIVVSTAYGDASVTLGFARAARTFLDSRIPTSNGEPHGG